MPVDNSLRNLNPDGLNDTAVPVPVADASSVRAHAGGHGRPRDVQEVAGWLARVGRVLAPATDAWLNRYPQTRWLVWSAGCSYRGLGQPGTRAYESLEALDDDFARTVVAPHLLVREVRNAVPSWAARATSVQLDAVRAWLIDERAPLPPDAPLVLVRESRATLANPRCVPPAWAGQLTPEQWDEGARYHHRYINDIWPGRVDGKPVNLIDDCVELLRGGELLRLARLPGTHRCATRGRRL